MKTGWKILLLLGGALGLSKLLKTNNTGKKISISLTDLQAKIVKGSLVLIAGVDVDNPTNDPLKLKTPNLKAFLAGKEIGNSIPSGTITVIKPNDRTPLKEINIQVPLINLGTLALSIATGNVPKLSLDVELSTVANGLPYKDRKHFEI